MPNVPTVADPGLPGFDMVSWYGLWGPANLPKDLSAKLAVERLGEQGFDAAGSSPEEFSTFLGQEFTKYSRIVKDANVKIE